MSCLFRDIRNSLMNVVVVLVAVNACTPVPDQKMTVEQKRADMLWLYSTFDENYAPLDYKMERFGLNYESLKSRFLDKALETTDNEQFYQVMHSFVAQFQDAHTVGSLTHGGLPNRAEIAYIGISGKRQGSHFVVTDLLPTYKKSTSFPIRVGDEISHVDGQSLTALIGTELLPLVNVGQDESNLTFLMNQIFNRTSLSHYFPTKKDVEITIARRAYTSAEREQIEEKQNRKMEIGEKKTVNLVVTVPWVIKDMYQFKKDQTLAKASADTYSTSPLQSYAMELASLQDLFKLEDANGETSSFLALRGFDGGIKHPARDLLMSIRGREGFNFLKTFYFPNQVEGWTADIQLNLAGKPTLSSESALTQLKKTRYVPKDAIFITSPDAVFPVYVTEEELHDRSDEEEQRGKRARYGKKRVATLYLNTFSPDGSEDAIVEEFVSSLENLQRLGVNDLVIDLINNGGGSLSLGMRLAQALSMKKVIMPAIQLRTSQTWRDEFLKMSLDAPSDSEQLLAKRMYNQLQSEMEAGNRLSSPVSAEVLLPFELLPNDRLRRNFHTVLLVNEMCASMCDIFSAIMQDNDLALVVGAKTMGAGGNVVSHSHAPNSHFMVRQTESLIVRKKVSESGTVLTNYIENQGVDPDFTMSVSEDSGAKYRHVRAEGLRQLTQIRRSSKTSARY